MDQDRQEAEEPAGTGSEPGDDVLSRLEERLDRASQAAERLVSEAAAAAVLRPPPSGWQRATGDEEPANGARATVGASEIELLLEALHALRDRIPPDLQHRLAVALREVLLAVRALIDWYLERAQRTHAARSEVQDIPIL